MNIYTKQSGFTLIEMLVAVAIIGVLSSVVYASLGNSRMASRDEARKADLKSLQLALEVYKAQYGTYPAAGCSGGTSWTGPQAGGSLVACDEYIIGLAPQFIPQLPVDPKDEAGSPGYLYKTNGTDYKILSHSIVEAKTVTSYNDEFARCPAKCVDPGCACDNDTPPATTYGVYSAGARNW